MSLDEYRAAINAADRVLLAAVNQRIDVVRALHAHKKETGTPLRDPAREESLVKELQAANEGPLSNDGVADLFHFVLALTRKEIHGE
ncbi:MAG: chorismate mutase [Actinobacteria bacterium]|nr:chorismate mutase [Actinomycetota bacterium]